MVKKTTEQFIADAQQIHGDKYDYSKVNYVNSQIKVCIICPEHGEFWQTPAKHLYGQDCPKCATKIRAQKKTKSIKDFIKDAKDKHNDKYNYSKVNYVNSKTKVCIICPEHGEFWQTPTGHLSGKGCLKCAGNIKKTTKDFIKNARKIHNNKYNYLKTDYINAKTRVCIICSDHGEFWQIPTDHLSGKGCPKCANEKQAQKQTKSTADFIKDAKKVHGTKYDYSKTKYVNSEIKVCIICPEHGEFWQRPNDHSNSRHGCPKCANKKQTQKQTKSIDKFIKDAKRVHDDRYDYSKVNYINSETKVCIICSVHGEFWQTPGNHLSGKGCKKCATEKLSIANRRSLNDFIYQAKKIHGDKYNYHLIKYTNDKTKIDIVCQKHGVFKQLPSSHLRGHGCPKCATEEKTQKQTKSTADFIKDAKKIHGTKYDYSKTKYVNSKTKVCIICSVHGEFWQRPNNHLSGKGCPKCLGKYKKTIEEFIENVKKIHGNKYNYSKVDYINNKTKVCIICSEHGEFWQTPGNHLAGNGCPKCANHKNTDIFIQEAKKIHGDKYDYSQVSYNSIWDKVFIICSKHGEFWQTPRSHLKGHGCPHCKESHLEREVRKILESKNEPYVYEKSFKWLTTKKGIMSLDFFLPKRNTAIEVQGIQHFKYDTFFHSNMEDFKYQIEKDDLKKQLCEEHGITVLYYADDKEYIKNYKYPVITNKEKLLEIILSNNKEINIPLLLKNQSYEQLSMF